MKVTNIVLSILVLLMALASAVFSYMLFGKRAQMLGGWEQLTAAISNSSAAIDKESGSNAAEGLTRETLSHTRYGELSANIEKYNTLVNDLISQRNKLAEALQYIAGITGTKVQLDQLQKFSSYADASAKVVNDVRKTQNYHRRVLEVISRDLSALRISCSADQLMKSNSSALDDLSKKLRQHQHLVEEYQSSLQEISSMSFRNRYQNKLIQQAIGRAQKFGKQIKELNSQLKKVDQERRSLLNDKRSLTQQVKTLNAKLKRQDEQINELRKVLGIGPNAALPMPWKEGSNEARLALSGKVVEVNNRYGYIGINIGTDTRVIQQLSKTKTGKINPKVCEGMKLKVFRGKLDDGTPDYVAEITLNKVGSSCSIADIPVGANIKVGDSICFDLPAKK